MLPLWARVGLGAMAMKGCSVLPKARALLESHHQIVLCHIYDTRYGSLTPLQKCSRCILQPSPSSRLGIYSLSVSSPGCKALYIVINFLVLWFICLSSSLVHFRNYPEYLTRGTAPMFSLLMRFLIKCLGSKGFLILLRYSYFLFFSFSLPPSV